MQVPVKYLHPGEKDEMLVILSVSIDTDTGYLFLVYRLVIVVHK